jgi:hypothetical protein
MHWCPARIDARYQVFRIGWNISAIAYLKPSLRSLCALCELNEKIPPPHRRYPAYLSFILA